MNNFDIIKLRNIIKRNKSNTKGEINQFSIFDIDLKFKEFDDWCINNITNYDKKIIFNFIEKMSIWYEMRYSNQQIDNIFHIEDISLDKNEFIDSKAIMDVKNVLNDNEKEIFSESINLLKWNDLFDFSTFYNTLNDYEKDLLNINSSSTLEEKILKDKILDMVLYKIIKNGDIVSGVERGFLFAKEFNRDLTIPFKYISRSPIRYKDMFLDLIKNGISLDFTCCMYYFSERIENVLRNASDIYIEIFDTKKHKIELEKNIIDLINLKLENEKSKILKK